jgi:hypothetical protein
MACLEMTEALLEVEKPASVEMKPEVAHEEVPLEDAAVMPVEEPRKRRRDLNLDARRRRKQQERTQKKDGCRKNLVAAQRDDPSCAKGTTQDFINKGDSGILWIPEESDHCRQEDDPRCESGTAQGNRHREKPHNVT